MADLINSASANSDLAYIAASRRPTNKKTSSVNFEDYITLMVAQLANQDMYNTADTKEMTSQLAQYSLVSAAESIIAGQNTNYAATLVGKQVTASFEDSMGNLVTNVGICTGITLYEGEPLVYVNGTPYNLSEIMIIGTTAAQTEEEGDASPEEAAVIDGVSEQTDAEQMIADDGLARPEAPVSAVGENAAEEGIAGSTGDDGYISI